MNYLTIGGVVAAALLGWWLGTNHVEGKWAKADKAALEAQKQLTEDALEKRDELQVKVTELTTELADRETALTTLSADLAEAINREPIINEVPIEVPGDCPVCRVATVDPVAHFRLWNAAVTGSATESELPVISTGLGDGRLWRSIRAARLDGGGRPDQARRPGEVGETEPVEREPQLTAH